MSNYSRQYTTGVNWENYTSTATPLSAGNLNRMDGGILRVDQEAAEAINSKANQAVVNGTVNGVQYDPDTGVFTFSFVDGSTVTVNTVLEKVVTNFTYDPQTQALILTLADGTTQSVDMSALITQYEFTDSTTIAWTIGQNGSVAAAVKAGSITGSHLQPDYLAQVTAQAQSAAGSAAGASASATEARSYAKGGTGSRSGEDTDNAKYYMEEARAGVRDFTGATSTAAGTHGLVPAPPASQNPSKFVLRSDGTWGKVESVPAGGTAGQILRKRTSADDDAEWITEKASLVKATDTHDIIGGGSTEDGTNVQAMLDMIPKVDTALSPTSTNPVRNSAVTAALEAVTNKYKSLTINNPASDTTLTGYIYAQSFAWSGVTAVTEATASVVSGYDVTDGLAVETYADGVKLYFGEDPTDAVIRVKIYPDGNAVT